MYRCIQSNFFQSGLFSFQAIDKASMEPIRLWRNAQIDILRQDKPLTKEQQTSYFEQVVFPSFDEKEPAQILWIIKKDEALIGYGGLVHINWQEKRAECSFLLDDAILETSSAFKDALRAFFSFLKTVAFDEIQLRKLTAEIYPFRQPVIALLEQVGFFLEGRLQEQIFKRGSFQEALIYGCLKPYEGPNVLVTSISKKVPLLQAVRQAMRKTKTFGRLIGADMNEEAVGRYWVDGFWHSPPLEKMSLESILFFCLEQNIEAIIPTRDADLLLYSKWQKKLPPIMTSAHEVVSCVNDKLTFAKKLLEAGLPAIATHEKPDAIDATYFVVKERFGAGGYNVGLKLSKEQAIVYAKQLAAPLFQPYIQGKEYSIDLYRTKKGITHAVVVRERNVIAAGESQVTTTTRHPALEMLTQKVADSLNLIGHAVLQVIESEGSFFIVECNARFGGASTASIAVGLDSLFWFLQEAQNHDPDPFQRSQCEVRQIRAPSDRILHDYRL